MTTQTTTKEISIELGFVNADKVKELFSDYLTTTNGYFFEVQGNKQSGVLIYTNCFKSKKELKKDLFNRMIISL